MYLNGTIVKSDWNGDILDRDEGIQKTRWSGTVNSSTSDMSMIMPVWAFVPIFHDECQWKLIPGVFLSSLFEEVPQNETRSSISNYVQKQIVEDVFGLAVHKFAIEYKFIRSMVKL